MYGSNPNIIACQFHEQYMLVSLGVCVCVCVCIYLYSLKSNLCVKVTVHCQNLCSLKSSGLFAFLLGSRKFSAYIFYTKSLFPSFRNQFLSELQCKHIPRNTVWGERMASAFHPCCKHLHKLADLAILPGKVHCRPNGKSVFPWQCCLLLHSEICIQIWK